MLTVGVDLAAEPANTAVARIRWTDISAEVQAVGVGVDDPVLAEEITASDKAGIDCPLGWPQRFVEFVAQHQAGAFVAPTDVAGKDWRRQLAPTPHPPRLDHPSTAHPGARPENHQWNKPESVTGRPRLHPNPGATHTPQ